MARLAAAYIKIRDARSVELKKFEAIDNKMKEQQGVLEAHMLKFLNEAKINSLQTDFGTIIRQQDIQPSAADWELVYDWIKKNDAFDMLERRIKKTFVTEYMETHQGDMPPGVNVHRKFVIRVRRS